MQDDDFKSELIQADIRLSERCGVRRFIFTDAERQAQLVPSSKNLGMVIPYAGDTNERKARGALAGWSARKQKKRFPEGVSIDELLQNNPEAARHEDSIRKTLKAVRDLRRVGIYSDSRGVGVPYKGKASIADAPRPTNKAAIRSMNSK